jgi:hypothetical protein
LNGYFTEAGCECDPCDDRGAVSVSPPSSVTLAQAGRVWARIGWLKNKKNNLANRGLAPKTTSR